LPPVGRKKLALLTTRSKGKHDGGKVQNEEAVFVTTIKKEKRV